MKENGLQKGAEIHQNPRKNDTKTRSEKLSRKVAYKIGPVGVFPPAPVIHPKSAGSKTLRFGLNKLPKVDYQKKKQLKKNKTMGGCFAR